MKITNGSDQRIYREELAPFLPPRIFDAHVHIFRKGYFPPEFAFKPRSVYHKFGGEFPIEEQPDYLNACDVAFVTLGKKMYGIGVPSKTYFNMACAKPLLVSGEDGMEIVEMTRKYGLGEIVATGDEDGYVDAISRMAAMPDLKKLGEHVREVLLANYSRKIASEKYRDFFAQFND